MINPWMIRIIEESDEMIAIEELQRQVWSGSERNVVPAHLLRGASHVGGLVIGAFEKERLVGFVFGFPGWYNTPDGPRLKHYSHMLAVHPEYHNRRIGFLLKRAQWQMVRHQGIDRITWTYDPLLSRNAWLNICRLGAVCNTYWREFYGPMHDDLNAGLPSDRFEVDWWVGTQRVNRRLSNEARQPLELPQYLEAETRCIDPLKWSKEAEEQEARGEEDLLLVEIPPDIMVLKATDPEKALEWRLRTREVFEDLFTRGYLVTDFVHQMGSQQRSFYVLTLGEATL